MPVTGSGRSFPFSTIRSLPAFSVTRMRPSGRKSIPHGTVTPSATVSSRKVAFSLVTTTLAAGLLKVVFSRAARAACSRM